MKSSSLRLHRELLGDLSTDELRSVAGGSHDTCTSPSYACEPSHTCPESYTCPQSYTCPITYIKIERTTSLLEC